MSDSSPSSGHPFSAAASATGYLYQCRYALLEALRRMKDEVDFQVCLETLDDVVFEDEGEAPELLQTKHHVGRPADLTDASVDLWKTLRIWCQGISDGLLQTDSRFMLVTTASAGSNSAAQLLRPGSGRNVSEALVRLRSTATTSSNAANLPAYAAFQDLDAATQEGLFKSIWVIDAAPTITSLDSDLRQELFYAVERRFLDAFMTRFEGWWFRRCVRHLSVDRGVPILSTELLARMNSLRDQLRDDNLPIDDDIEQMKVDATGHQGKLFVRQLQLIQIRPQRIVRAIRDYYRAFAQRSRWVREDLIGVGDLKRYERRLRDAWEGHFLAMQDELGDDAAEAEMQRLALQVYKWVDTGDLPPIRPRCQDGFVARGSFHIMADRLDVGWHPDFENRLRDVLDSVA